MTTRKGTIDNPVPATGASASLEPAGLPAPGTIVKVQHIPRVIPEGQLAAIALKALPHAGIGVGDRFLVESTYGAWLLAERYARQTYPDTWLGTQHESIVLADGRILTRYTPLLVGYEVALAAVQTCDHGDSRAGGLYKGAVRFLTEEVALAWNEKQIPPDPRPNIFGKPSELESPPIRVKANDTGSIGQYFDFVDQQEVSVCEWMAVVGTFRQNRHGESLLTLLEPLTPRGERFRRAVAAFMANTPGWNTHSDGFPSYHAA